MIVVTLTCVSNTALSQERTPGRFFIGGAAGAAFLLGDFQENATAGFGALGLVLYTPRGWRLGLQGDVFYSRVSLENATLPDGELSADGSAKVFGPGLSLLYDVLPERRIAPYFIAGLGVYLTQVEVGLPLGGGPRVTEQLEETNVALTTGLGLRVDVGRTRGALEARYRRIRPDDINADLVSLTIGLAF
ncbi:MAG: hypothetical protein ACREON_15290 [Gemmatimonadaceae bacterium]